jgi:pyruvate formate lyase activating enzyme
MDQGLAGPGPGGVAGRYWQLLADGRIQCDLCPRFCRLREGQRGLCYVRQRCSDEILLTAYGRSSGFCVDPVEKKPLYHFLPGTAVLSFGTVGCNLACKFCQNWDISKVRESDRLQHTAAPQTIARAAAHNDCSSVAFTYNDPVIFLEYAVDTAAACHDNGIRTIAVSAGYICAEPREEFFRHMDAVNIDLKAFDGAFYRKLCGARLEPVLETLEYLAGETDTWLEITNLVIPGENDSDEEIDRMSRWIADRLGTDVPLHFSAFHPAWKMSGHAATPLSTLRRARRIALQNGLRHVYTGNVHDPDSAVTSCPACGAVAVSRSAYRLEQWNLSVTGGEARCEQCGEVVAGVFVNRPGACSSRRPLSFDKS